MLFLIGLIAEPFLLYTLELVCTCMFVFSWEFRLVWDGKCLLIWWGSQSIRLWHFLKNVILFLFGGTSRCDHL